MPEVLGTFRTPNSKVQGNVANETTLWCRLLAVDGI